MIDFCFALRFDASDIGFHISGHTLSGLEVVCFLVSLLPDHIHPAVVHSTKWILWKPVHESDTSRSPSTLPLSSILSNITSKDVRVFLVTSIFQWNKERFFSRHVHFNSGFHIMTVNEVSWDRPKITLGFTIIPWWVLSWGWRRPFWFFEELLVLLLCLGCPGLKWMFSDLDLLKKKKIDCCICDWEDEMVTLHRRSHFPLHWAFWRGFQTRPPAFQCRRPECLVSRFTAPNWCSLDLSFAEMEWYSTIAPDGITGPLNGIPNRLSYGDFPSSRRSWIFRR